MSLILLMIGFLVPNAFSQTMDVRWSDRFTKELIISCDDGIFCETLCGDTSCIQEEGICHNCIGTGLQIYKVFWELGKSIRRGEEMHRSLPLELLLRGNFVTFTPNDVYNVIDPVNSISVYKKFEALCPGVSESQIVFFEVDPHSRKLLAPFSVYCEYAEGSFFFELLVHSSAFISKTGYARHDSRSFYPLL